jgi:16S rRNA (cytidine1402-2'-O)-methyltransferase
VLYVIATPIGNPADLSPRAVAALQAVSLILCEDTRTSFPLLREYGINAPLRSYHKFNEQAAVGGVIAQLQSGGDVALITDAGTPCVSDPGYLLVKACAENGIAVTPIPGASALIAALSISGFNIVSFTFRGFLPRTEGKLRRVISDTLSEPSPVTVFYEAPHRILETVRVCAEEIPGSRLCLCNDLTKAHERIYRGTTAEVLEELSSNPNFAKGEYVMVLARDSVKPITEPSDDDTRPVSSYKKKRRRE